MVDVNVVTSKMAELAMYIERVRSHCLVTEADLAADRDALDIVAFNLMLAIQTCINIVYLFTGGCGAVLAAC